MKLHRGMSDGAGPGEAAVDNEGVGSAEWAQVGVLAAKEGGNHIDGERVEPEQRQM